MRRYSPDGMEDITHAIGILQSGDQTRGRQLLLQLWGQWKNKDAPRERCTIAHFLADTEDTVGAELQWDLIALDAATGAGDETDNEAIIPELEAFLPSLHLNVGDAHRRLGELHLARFHTEAGLRRATVLGDDHYASMIKTGLVRLLERLNSGPA